MTSGGHEVNIRGGPIQQSWNSSSIHSKSTRFEHSASSPDYDTVDNIQPCLTLFVVAPHVHLIECSQSFPVVRHSSTSVYYCSMNTDEQKNGETLLQNWLRIGSKVDDYMWVTGCKIG